jgi:hypothetical protein
MLTSDPDTMEYSTATWTFSVPRFRKIAFDNREFTFVTERGDKNLPYPEHELLLTASSRIGRR